MSDAMYAPPQAAVEVAEGDNVDYYVVKPFKFYLLALLTMNGYLVYWFYRNWRTVKLRTGRNVWPVMRAIFSPFFAHSLFRQIDDDAQRAKLALDWKPMLMATLYVLTWLVLPVMGQLSVRSIGSPFTDLAGPLAAPIVPLFLLGAQRAANAVSGDPGGATNGRLTLANWAWMLFGLLVWAMNLAGIYFIVTQPELFAQ